MGSSKEFVPNTDAGDDEGSSKRTVTTAFRQAEEEVPGFDGKGPDRQNIDILKAIRQRVGLDL